MQPSALNFTGLDVELQYCQRAVTVSPDVRFSSVRMTSTPSTSYLRTPSARPAPPTSVASVQHGFLGSALPKSAASGPSFLASASETSKVSHIRAVLNAAGSVTVMRKSLPLARSMAVIAWRFSSRPTMVQQPPLWASAIEASTRAVIHDRCRTA